MRSLERQMIHMELLQRREEGCNVAGLDKRIDDALADDSNVDDAAFTALYDELDGLEPASDFAYQEPSELAAIRELRPAGVRRMSVALSEDEVRDRIYGAWLGRAAGCTLGKPVEGWPRERIDKYLASVGALPLDNYIPYTEDVIARHLRSSTRDNIAGMARDDDMDYPILGLLALESRGAEFTPRNMANVWLNYMPFSLLYTAENNAYRNFVNGFWPPLSASWRNPFREWIGAQIRADIFGYVTPGWPEKAAEFAFRDASISHVKNGIYGEMFVAAMLAAGFVTNDITEIIEIGLAEIPANCRLAEAVRDTLVWCKASSNWEIVWEQIEQRYGHYHGVHTINNAALVVMGLMFGAEDYETGIVNAVRGGWDTDCNGATVGSILGIRLGASKMPDKWIGVLEDRLTSSVRDCNDNRISELAARTHRIAQRIATLPDEEEAAELSVPLSAEAAGTFPGSWRLKLPWGKHVLRIRPDLSGEIELEPFDEVRKVLDVSVIDNHVQFKFGVDKGGYETIIRFEGNITGDNLTGDCMTGGTEFSATGVRI